MATTVGIKRKNDLMIEQTPPHQICKKRKLIPESSDRYFFFLELPSGESVSVSFKVSHGIKLSEEERKKVTVVLLNCERSLKLNEFAMKDSLKNRLNKKDFGISKDDVNFEVEKNKIFKKFEVGFHEMENDRSIFKKLLSRLEKNIGLVAIPHSDFQFFIYSIKDTNTKEVKIMSLLMSKFTFVFDLDHTLICSRVAVDDDVLGKDEFSLKAFEQITGVKIITRVKKNTKRLLKWSTQLFKTVVCTNSLFPYAYEILCNLDPRKETILKNVNNVSDLKKILTTRDDLPNIQVTSKSTGEQCSVKVKILESMGLDEFSTLILDDQSEVWVNNQMNCLNFHEIFQNELNERIFFEKLKRNVWEKLTSLQEHILDGK